MASSWSPLQPVYPDSHKLVSSPLNGSRCRKHQGSLGMSPSSSCWSLHAIPMHVLCAYGCTHAEGEYCCPVTSKIFTPHTHIVAIKTTGNVYSYDAVDELCVKPKNWKDLLTDEPFTRKDIIHIQDPLNVSGKVISDFHHVKFVSTTAVAVLLLIFCTSCCVFGTFASSQPSPC